MTLGTKMSEQNKECTFQKILLSSKQRSLSPISKMCSNGLLHTELLQRSYLDTKVQPPTTTVIEVEPAK